MFGRFLPMNGGEKVRRTTDKIVDPTADCANAVGLRRTTPPNEPSTPPPGSNAAMRRRDFLQAAVAAAVSVAGCRRRPSGYGPPWDDILARLPPDMAALVADPAHEVQALYTRIDRDAAQRPTLTTAPLALAPRRWFTAASWVKLPAVLLAAERLTALGLDASARIVLDTPPATGNWDANEPLDEPFERSVRRLFTVSDNVPFNRLYDYLGQQDIGASLAAHGYEEVRLIARLGSPDAERNRSVAGSRVLDGGGQEVERREARTNPQRPAFPFGPALKGRGWQADTGELVPGPHDFSYGNFLPLAAMHRMLTGLLFPDAVPPAARWQISSPLRATILTELARWPRESRDPVYPPPEHFDGYAKYFIVGDRQEPTSPDVRQFSKCGQAYGYLQDCAYVIDRAAGVEFLLTATIHANADGIFNDDRYEYEQVAVPFLAALGRAVLQYERERAREIRPVFDGLPAAWT